MDYFTKTKNEFTAYIKTVIQNSSTDYKRKFLKTVNNEISVAEFTSLKKELFTYDDSSFLFEKDITYANIENLFTNEKHYRAMKKLSDKEKLVLFLTIIEEKQAEQVADIMNTTKENIRKIKSRAIKNFLNNLSNRRIERGCIFMNDKEFVLLLQKATENDESAIYEIIRLFEKLIYKNSFVNGRIDEDCKAYIESKLIPAIKKFKI